ncbi:MAG: hypothetical protein AAFY72_05795 [Cyanobacteria bacterium J06649_4]
MANTSLRDIVAQKLLGQQLLGEQRKQAFICSFRVKLLIDFYSFDLAG